MQTLPDVISEARWIGHARARLRHLCPYLPKRPGHNKRLRKAAGLIQQVSGHGGNYVLSNVVQEINVNGPCRPLQRCRER